MPMLGEYDLDRLLDALRMQESGGNNNAVSPKGARGEYQFMEPTWRDPGYGVPARAGGTWENFLANPQLQREQAGKYLTALYGKTGSVPAALASYNGGLKRGLAFKQGRPVPAETANYVPKVLKNYRTGAGTQPNTGLSAMNYPSPARLRFDQLINMLNPISSAQAAEVTPPVDAPPPPQVPMDPMAPYGHRLFHPAMTAADAGPKEQDRMPFMEGVNQLDAPAGAQPYVPSADQPQFSMPDAGTPQLPMERGYADPTAVPPQMPGAGYPQDPQYLAPQDAEIDPYAERLRTMYDRPSQDDYGLRQRLGDAGMAIGAGLMTASGIPVNAPSLAANEINRRNLALKERELQVEQQMMGDTYKMIREMNPDMPAEQAFILAASGKGADYLNSDDYGVDPQAMLGNDGQIYWQQFSKSRKPRVYDNQRQELSDDQLKQLQLVPVGDPRILDTPQGWQHPYARTPDSLSQGKTRAQAQADLGKELEWSNTTLGLLDQALSPQYSKGLEDMAGFGADTDMGRAARKVWSSEARRFNTIFEPLLAQDYIRGFQSVKGAGPVSEKEGLAGANAQSRLRAAIGANPEEFRKAAMELQYMMLRRQVKAYEAAGAAVPEQVRQQLATARRNVGGFAEWMEGNGTVHDYTRYTGNQVSDDAMERFQQEQRYGTFGSGQTNSAPSGGGGKADWREFFGG